ncbi:MAG: DNA polymerase [Thaumarchaeota archaeon]|nr:DNA polymerase [Nitrososphaerota archaeon]
MLYTDFESRGVVNLRGQKSVSLYNYVRHPQTEPLLLGWAFDQEPIEVWQLHEGPMPEKLRKGLKDPKEEIAAFNSSFERYMFNFKLGFNLPIERFQDPQASARYLSLPGDLMEVSNILGLPRDFAKDKEGDRLIHMFSEQSRRKKKRGEPAQFYFRDWITDPEDWALFVEYCRQDVVAEREVMRREKLLGVWPLPDLERKIWIFDQKVNDRGIPVDIDFAKKAFKLANQEKQETIQLNNVKTGLENSNSNSQLLEWAMGQGYLGLNPEDSEKYSLDKGVVKSQLKNNQNLTPLCREVLENRKAAASISYQKMAAILRQISPDDRLRNQFIYMGSSRCGRWSGNAVQLHNMARPNEIFEDEENIDKARAMIYAEDYQKIKDTFGSVLLTVKYNIRTAFVTRKGKRFNVRDLNAIETRVGAWVAGCESLLEGFRNIPDFDPYMDFAMKMTQIPYEILQRDKKSKDPAVKAKAKAHRQIAKPGVLGCIYRMGAKALLDYAEKMGVIMTMEQAEEVVRIFREAYKEIVHMWFTLEKAIAEVLAEGTVRIKREVGPSGCIKIDKFVFDCGGNLRTILRIQLPSGRYLHYMDASLEEVKMPWKDREGNDVYKMALCYATQDQETKQWVTVTSHGGKTFENIVQGIARDVLAAKLLDFEDAGMPVVLHVHDEGGTETEDDLFAPGLLEMGYIMARPIDWAPGLPLGSDGFEGSYYRKG